MVLPEVSFVVAVAADCQLLSLLLLLFLLLYFFDDEDDVVDDTNQDIVLNCAPVAQRIAVVFVVAVLVASVKTLIMNSYKYHYHYKLIRCYLYWYYYHQF